MAFRRDALENSLAAAQGQNPRALSHHIALSSSAIMQPRRGRISSMPSREQHEPRPHNLLGCGLTVSETLYC